MAGWMYGAKGIGYESTHCEQCGMQADWLRYVNERSLCEKCCAQRGINFLTGFRLPKLPLETGDKPILTIEELADHIKRFGKG